MPEAEKLRKLADLRRSCSKSQKDAAAYFGLAESARNEISKWENGEKIPPPKYRDLFIAYFCDFLHLAEDQERFDGLWAILQEQWGWDGLTDQERRRYFPTVEMRASAPPLGPASKQQETQGQHAQPSAPFAIETKPAARAYLPLRNQVGSARIKAPFRSALLKKLVASVLVLAVIFAGVFFFLPRQTLTSVGLEIASALPTATCYGAAVDISTLIPANGIATTSKFMTSARCLDINVKFTSLPEATEIRAVQCQDVGKWQGDWHKFSPHEQGWTIIASNLLDGTCFQLEMRSLAGHSYKVIGHIAY